MLLLFAALYILFLIAVLAWFRSIKHREADAIDAFHEQQLRERSTLARANDAAWWSRRIEPLPRDSGVAGLERLERARAVISDHKLYGLHVGYVGNELLITGRGLQIEGPDQRVLHCLSHARTLADFVHLMNQKGPES